VWCMNRRFLVWFGVAFSLVSGLVWLFVGSNFLDAGKIEIPAHTLHSMWHLSLSFTGRGGLFFILVLHPSPSPS
jgi:hypothetical protein